MGVKGVRKENKNNQCLAKIEKMIADYQPNVIALEETSAHGRSDPPHQSGHKTNYHLSNTIEAERYFVFSTRNQKRVFSRWKRNKTRRGRNCGERIPR